MKLAMTLLDCPNCAIEKQPNLFKRITWGIVSYQLSVTSYQF